MNPSNREFMKGTYEIGISLEHVWHSLTRRCVFIIASVSMGPSGTKRDQRGEHSVKVRAADRAAVSVETFSSLTTKESEQPLQVKLVI